MKVLASVKAVIMNGDKFLFLKETFNGKLIYDLPGGKVEHGENPYESLHREIMEETCLEVEILKPLGMWWFFRMKDNNQVICNTFLCKPKHTNVDISKNPVNEPIFDYLWITKKDFLNGNYDEGNFGMKELIKKI